MYGAILGDIIGSPYEFNFLSKDAQFPLFLPQSHFTDDTVLTIAIADALTKAGKNASLSLIKREAIIAMKHWAHCYKEAGYGHQFKKWVFSSDKKPYKSWGNGASMRISPVGWYYDSIERTISVARTTAKITHNHPDAIRSAEEVVTTIFLAREGFSKIEIYKYLEQHFRLNITSISIPNTTEHCENSKLTIPLALKAFFDGDNFEETIRIAISFGRDADTIGSISGAIAEAYYGIPTWLIDECNKRINPDFQMILRIFSNHSKWKM